MTYRPRPPFGLSRTRKAQPLRMSQPTITARTPEQIEAAELRAEAAATWASLTGLSASDWIGKLDPFVEPVVDAVLEVLRNGVAVSMHGVWAVVTADDGRRLVLASDLLSDVLRRSSMGR